ncbi:D-glycero-alpha-D-manno-heptose-1,7-bisphosphate 7-phosphatase [Desulforamulus aquiferis]|uniref:D,D-heptose 1,7-bisphosphate phosphatase n=1 Tax=Desulforamulus aquiferis TaxID=1397668 RepID=A0AAW7ZGE7_9FIRM|nr:HAD family hydrolase [Desulforamulus aquiferis]MDO7788442.1 HAD family hydrolase [Desulforamulus aquiferis]RYD05684.1 hypothetical protein N752_07245 [Desulforamulus aquiferis]
MKNKALFLDRDGVINKEKNYLFKISEFEFIDGVFDILRYFESIGYLLIIVTNQSGIGRGYYTVKDFLILSNWMLQQFKEEGINITKVYYSPFHPHFGINNYKKDSFCRKPGPGMLIKASSEFGVNLGDSIMVGDKESDIEAGLNAGVGTTVLVRSGNNIGDIRGTRANFILPSIKELKTVLTGRV